MIMKSIHNKLNNNSVAVMLGTALLLIVFCIFVGLGKLKDTFKNIWDSLYYG